MVRELPESSGSVLGFEVVGKVSLEEESELIARIDAAIEEHRWVSVLVVLGEKAGWGVETSIGDLNWLIAPMKRLDKIAVISEGKTWDWLRGHDSPFVKMVAMGEKHYEPARIADAWTWLKG